MNQCGVSSDPRTAFKKPWPLSASVNATREKNIKTRCWHVPLDIWSYSQKQFKQIHLMVPRPHLSKLMQSSCSVCFAGMDFHEELPRLGEKEGLKGRKQSKAVESFTWNITVLRVSKMSKLTDDWWISVHLVMFDTFSQFYASRDTSDTWKGEADCVLQIWSEFRIHFLLKDFLKTVLSLFVLF